MKYSFTPDDITLMQEMRDSGMLLRDIAAHFRCTANYITAHTRRTGSAAVLDRGKAQALRNAGWSFPEIAQELKCSVDDIVSVVTERVPAVRRPLEGLWTTF